MHRGKFLYCQVQVFIHRVSNSTKDVRSLVHLFGVGVQLFQGFFYPLIFSNYLVYLAYLLALIPINSIHYWFYLHSVFPALGKVATKSLTSVIVISGWGH